MFVISHIARLSPLALGLFVSSVCTAAESYRLAVQVERNGIVVVDTTADVEAGANADLKTSATDTVVETRVLARVAPEQSGGDVAVHLQYFEKRNEDWVLLGEPSLITSLGGDADVEFSADSADHRADDRYTFRLAVTANDVNMLTRSGGCADQEYPMLIADGANPKCCSTKEMTCCNVKRCCDNRPGHGDCCDTK